VCSAHRVVSNYIPFGFYPETLKWHVPSYCANWTEEARVKKRVANGFSSLLLALEICLPLRALELSSAWTAIIMDTRNGENCYPLSGQRLWCDFTVKLLRRLPVFWQGNCHGNGFKRLTLRFDSHQEPSTTSVLAAVHFEVMCEKMCFCREHWISDSRKQVRNYKQWAGGWSILDFLLCDANSNNFACDDTFGAGCSSRIRANVALLTLSILLLV